MDIVQIFQHADFKQPWRVYLETMPAGEELLLCSCVVYYCNLSKFLY